MNKKVSLIVIYALFAATCNMNAMDGQGDNFLSVSRLPDNPSNSPYITTPSGMKKSPSAEEIGRALFKISSEIKKENDNSSGSRARSGSVSEEITPRSRSNPSSSREASPIRKNELEEVMLGILSKNCSSTNVYIYGSMEERGNFLCVTFEKDGKKQEIKAAISDQNQDFKFIQACDENGETFFIQLNKPVNFIDDFREINQQLQEQQLKDSQESEESPSSEIKLVKEIPVSDISPEASALLKKIDAKPENSTIKLKTAQECLDDLKNSKKPFLKLKDPRKFVLGMSVLVILIGWYMYKFNKLPDFMANIINKVIPASYSH